MKPTTSCIICDKHQDLASFVGVAVSEQSGLVLAHFPYLSDEKATRGHLILEPRRHITEIDELNEGEAAALGKMLKHGTQLIKTYLGAEHVYVFRINDKVAHLHFHLVPRYSGTPPEWWGTKIMTYPDRPTLTREQIATLSQDLRAQSQSLTQI